VFDVLWVELLDPIHHRGQVSVYLRLAGAKLPSIYGPTAARADRPRPSCYHSPRAAIPSTLAATSCSAAERKNIR